MSSPRRIGLPETIRMRHDPHFVDQLVRPSGEAIGRLIPVEDIAPNPDQPRQALGDLEELTASIREKGVLESMLVRRVGSHYQIIAGERRYRAAVEAGLGELPCVVRETSDAEMMELALVENLQRKDLTPFEEGDGLEPPVCLRRAGLRNAGAFGILAFHVEIPVPSGKCCTPRKPNA